MDTHQMLQNARKAVRRVGTLDNDTINNILNVVADALVTNASEIIEANMEDLAKLSPEDYRYDRLLLNESRIHAIASDMRNVAKLPSPRRVLEERTLPNGMELRKVAVPFGVIGVIYEARPNVSADVFSLCLKSGNVCVLKGGHDAESSNRAIVGIIRKTLADNGVPEDAVTLLPSTRQATAELLRAQGLVDLIIPRGSKALIDNVRQNALIPVIETGAGVCHCYVDKTADADMAARIIDNAKTRRVSVCNALDCVLIHSDALDKLPAVSAPLAAKEVTIHADRASYDTLKGIYPEHLLHLIDSPDAYGTEYLSMQMAIKTVTDIEEAVEHIDNYGSGHSECIVTGDDSSTRLFSDAVDAACVYVNVPTSFTDGAQFGLGAEIGISTQKLHARGPMALAELMTYKWVVSGNGQTRP